MQSMQDVTNTGSSLGSRRPYAQNLPALTGLPPPPMAQLHDKYQPYEANTMPSISGSTNSLASAGNLLTPPNTLPGEASPSNGMPSSSNAPLQLPSIPSPNSGAFWNNGLPSIPQFAPYNSAPSPGQWIPPRGMYSPSSIDSLLQSRNPPMGGQSYELNHLPPFSANMAGMSSGPITLPAMVAAQQMQNVNAAFMNGPLSGSGSSSNNTPALGQDTFGGRPPPTPAYFSNSQASPMGQVSPPMYQYGSSSANSQASPISPGDGSVPHSNANPLTRTHSGGQTGNTQSSHQFQRPTFNHYPSSSLSASSLSSLSGLHRQTSDGQMPTFGRQTSDGQMPTFGSLSNGQLNGYSGGSMQSMYNQRQSPPRQQHTGQPQHQTPSDRPFKCDSCPQSFNRNHDLKRHKRIHLAVKPYPCGHCDKSFSRKDALKRHILVKGCGKSSNSDAVNDDGSADSDSSPVLSDVQPNLQKSESEGSS